MTPPSAPSLDRIRASVDAARDTLVRRARWDGATCHWPAPTGASMNGSVFDGTAGTALFLGEAGTAFGHAEASRTAEGATRHALRWAETLPPHALGVHAGRVGVAAVADRIGTLLGRPALREEARALLPTPEPSLDEALTAADLSVVGGAAGAIPALLHLAEAGPEADRLGALAHALGRILMHRAIRTDAGWCWDTVPFPTVRRLVGLAHGTTGIARALFELDRAGAGAEFGYAADRAWAYEETHYVAGKGWPDYRYFGLGSRVSAIRSQPPRARPQFVASEVPPYAARHFPFWHHGAAGIALVRLHAAQASATPGEQARHLCEADRAVDLLSRWAASPTWAFVQPNASLCDGTAGVATALAEASRVLDRPDLLDAAHRLGASWAAALAAEAPDVSLMKGIAGTALVALRLLDPSIPSVALPPGATGLASPPSDWAAARGADTAAGWSDTAHDDPSRRWTRDLLRVPLDAVDWDRDRFRLADGVRIDDTRPAHLRVSRTNASWAVALPDSAAAALRVCTTPASVHDITVAAFGADTPEARSGTRAILSQAHTSGALDVLLAA